MFVNAAEVGGTTRSQAHADHGGIYCSNEENILFRLAYLITGDEVQAEDSIIAAYDLAEQGETPFRDWRLEWAKCATVRSAIEARLAEIRGCEDRYKNLDRKGPRHRPQAMRNDLPAMTESILCLDPEMVISELDPLARAILVLRGVLSASVRDCSVQLNVSSESVLAVQRRITTWLTTVRKKQLPVLQRPA
jgi:hypothetical protein